ncbi:ferritin-like domain-containing protein [Acidiluteibacter ferrifornacis]|uniref:Iminophenyl-pyruvate dimer synthase domain-containing protein n=1 Tax=Acidiluteibacter ferrifornacis TaxID=2692424 RepID=A0A6N9NKJ2_9FLAO|nr:ferritin-like domain-containing protein [Acidiluteibacter ferrifornacis]MBR9832739.1 hypothetical protein [bacterium]NBG65687.1 hypothetical protein [Acidiluteibacter ferrifornacis]
MKKSTPIGQSWTKENLTKALNTAVAVELFTIPVYLSAASSIKMENRADKVIPATVHSSTSDSGTVTELFSAYDVIMSVAVQEMYHLTLACNIANALGVRPSVTAPDLNNPPSCLNGIIGKPVKGNLSTLIDTMLAIEAPDPNYHYDENPSNPVSPNGPKLYQEEYDSIGDLYHALAYGVEALWDELYSADNDAYQKLNFQGKYGEVKQSIQTLEDALNAMACIVEEGEGNGAEGFMPGAYVPEPGQEYQELDEISHWERFNDIKTYLKTNTIPQYQETNSEVINVAQGKLTEAYSKVINQMNADFSSPNTSLNLRGMSETGTLATSVWQGGEAPQWNYTSKPTPWPPIPADAHVCQGLNMCAGKGFNNSGTGPGDGDCATVEQACSTSNQCKGLGGCGYAPAGQTPTPGLNDCSGQGGCQSPISPCQVYSKGTKTYGGKHVWEVARTLFEEKVKKAGKTVKPNNGKVMPRRYSPALNPTSGDQGNTCPLPTK